MGQDLYHDLFDLNLDGTVDPSEEVVAFQIYRQAGKHSQPAPRRIPEEKSFQSHENPAANQIRLLPILLFMVPGLMMMGLAIALEVSFGTRINTDAGFWFLLGVGLEILPLMALRLWFQEKRAAKSDPEDPEGS